MPSKKKKYNARFPAGRIKKIMQSDEEVGKVAQAVPIIISRTLELFVGSLLTKTMRITNSRNAKTLSPSHMKQCIMSENRFDFLRELVKNIPDISIAEEINTEYSPDSTSRDKILDQPFNLSLPSTSNAVKLQKSNGFPNGIDVQKNLQLNTGNEITRTYLNKRNLNSSSVNYCAKDIQCSSNNDKTTITKISGVNVEKKCIESDSNLIENAKNKNIENTLNKHLITPAPIVNIDICNKPIVKIDYSHLALPEKQESNMSHINKEANYKIKPVNKLNLSLNSILQPSLSAFPSSLELDEDYDNI